MSDLIEHLKAEVARNQRLADRSNTERRKRMHKYRAIHLQRAIAEIEQLTKIAKAAEMVSSMSFYDEEADEVDPCHMVYFEELESALIEWRGSTVAGPYRAETTKDTNQ